MLELYIGLGIAAVVLYIIAKMYSDDFRTFLNSNEKSTYI